MTRLIDLAYLALFAFMAWMLADFADRAIEVMEQQSVTAPVVESAPLVAPTKFTYPQYKRVISLPDTIVTMERVNR